MEDVGKLAEALSIRPYELFLESGVDDSLDGSSEALRSYAKEAGTVATKAVKDALQALANHHLDK